MCSIRIHFEDSREIEDWHRRVYLHNDAGVVNAADAATFSEYYVHLLCMYW